MGNYSSTRDNYGIRDNYKLPSLSGGYGRNGAYSERAIVNGDASSQGYLGLEGKVSSNKSSFKYFVRGLSGMGDYESHRKKKDVRISFPVIDIRKMAA